MPEGVGVYPRWDGPLRTGSSIPLIAGQEVKRAFNNFWSRFVLMFILAYTVFALGNLYTLTRGPRGDEVHTVERFLDFLQNLRWGALSVAAIMAGPALLEDAQRGALELYLTRAVSRAEYLLGKILAVFGIAFLSMAFPALLYYALSFILGPDQPAGWGRVPGGAALYGLMVAAMAAGLGLGLSCVARSARAATLVLLGAVALADLFISNVLEGITKNEVFQILSPFSALEQQTSWIFNVPEKYAFPAWWGIVEWLALTLIGWALVAWRHPRVRGAERAGA